MVASSLVRILILVTGEPIEPVRHCRGPFARLFEAGLTRQRERGGVEIVTHDLTAHGADAPLPSLDGFHGAIMTGSPAYVGDDAPWMRYGARIIERILETKLPFLAVCFGHQLLGVATGADVGENPRGREIGTIEIELSAADDPLFGALPARLPVQVTHRDVIRAPGPRLTVLGSAPHDPCHVVRAGPAAWGVQFHPEFDEDVIRAYLSERRALLDEAHGPGTAERRLAAVRPSVEASSLLETFADLCRSRAAAAMNEVHRVA